MSSLAGRGVKQVGTVLILLRNVSAIDNLGCVMPSSDDFELENGYNSHLFLTMNPRTP